MRPDSLVASGIIELISMTLEPVHMAFAMGQQACMNGLPEDAAPTSSSEGLSARGLPIFRY